MSRFRRHIIIIALLGLFAAQSIVYISNKSATFDEGQHFGIGKYLLLHQRWDVMGSILHPPLGYYLTSLPLLFYPYDESLWKYAEVKRDIVFLGGVDVVRGQGMLSAPENAGDRLLILSRLTVLAVALLLGVYVYRFSSEIYGVRGGMLSLAIYSFCPTMLAFSGICTQDMPLAAFSFITMYYFWHYLRNQLTSAGLLTGLFLGTTLATKFTGFLLLPLMGGLYVLSLRIYKMRPRSNVLLIPALAIVILFGSYGFNIEPFIQGNEYRLLEMNRGQSAFFNGNHSIYGWWYYYFAVLALKSPLPYLILYAFAVLTSVKCFKDNVMQQLFLSLPVAIFITVFSCSNYSVGVRYLLPMFPFTFVCIGGVMRLNSNVAKGVICCLAMWQIFGTVNIHPDYLAYFNELAGGADNGYSYLVDSNLDWGQDLKGLKKYMDANGIKKISLSYFGTDSPQRYGIDYDWLPSHYLFNPHPELPYEISPNQILAVSATNLQGVYLDSPDEFAWLRPIKPKAKIGHSIFIYDPQEILRSGLKD
jgi:hypothetical protein